jgi:rod shape-determining protein MreD
VHWIAFAIVLYGVIAVQASLAPLMAVHSIRPDLPVVAAVYFGLTAKPQDAVVAGWLIGLAIDLSSVGYAEYSNVGVHALFLGLIVWLMVKARELALRESIWTILFSTFFAKMSLSLLVGLHMTYVLDGGVRYWDVVSVGFYAATYTALVAPYGHWMLHRLRRPLGLSVAGRLRAG